MKINEINKPIKEYRNVVIPRDETHYREMMKTLHDLELKSVSDPATMAEIQRRRRELRNWAEQNLKREDKEEIGNYATLKSTGQDVRIVDFDENDNTYQISYGEGKGEDWVDGKDLEFIDPTVHQDLGQVGEDAVDTSKWKDNAIIRNYPPDDLDGDSYVWKGGQWIHDETGKVAPRDVGKILTKLTKDEELSGDLEGGIIRDSSLTNQQKQGLQKINTKYGNYFGNNADPLPQGYIRARFDTGIGTDGIESDELEAALKKFGYEDMDDAEAKDEDFYDTVQEYLPITNAMTNDMAKVMGNDIDDDDKMVDALTYLDSLDESIREDAGEQGLANELSKYYQDAADGLDPEDHGNDEHEDYLDIARSFKKGLQAGMDSVNNSGWEFSTNDFDMDRDGKGKMYEPMAELLKKYNVSAGIENGESFLTKNGKAITKPAQESVEEDMIPNNMPGNIGDYAHEKSTGKLVRIVDYTDDDEGIYTISYGEDQGETDVTAGDLEFVDPTVNQDLDDKILDKEIEEAPIEQDRDNPIAKPYVDTPEWKALHDMDDKIIQAYIKHKKVAEADGLQSADLKRLGQNKPKVYVHKDGKTIMVPKDQANNYIAKGWKKSALRAETSYESKLADMLNQRLK